MYLSRTKSQTYPEYESGSSQNNLYSNPNRDDIKVKFKYNSTEFLNEDEKQKFEQFLENPIFNGTMVTITGFASSEGNADDNQSLSDRRANKIANLIRAKYPNTTIVARGAGEQEGEFEENRSVQISVESKYVWEDPTSSNHYPKLAKGNYSTRVTGEQSLSLKLPPSDQDVVIYLSGLRFWGLSDGDYQNAPYEDDNIDIVQQIQAFAERSNRNVAAQAFVSGWLDPLVKGPVKNFIERNLGENGKLIIVGYSWGGDTALELSEQNNWYTNLDNKIDLLIIIDASDGWGATNQRAGGMANRVINYYQPIKQLWPPTASGQRILEDAPNVTNLLKDRTKSGGIIDHSNIDEEVLDDVVRDIISELRKE